MKKVVNPDMLLTSVKSNPVPEQHEHEGAKMPQVGKFPTGMEAAKKFGASKK